MQLSNNVRWALVLIICCGICVWYSRKTAEGPDILQLPISLRNSVEEEPETVELAKLDFASSASESPAERIANPYFPMESEIRRDLRNARLPLADAQPVTVGLPYPDTTGRDFRPLTTSSNPSENAAYIRVDSGRETASSATSATGNELNLEAMFAAEQESPRSALDRGMQDLKPGAMSLPSAGGSSGGQRASIAPPPNIHPETAVHLAEQIEYGSSLARRGAHFSAQKQFMNVLYLVAQHRDLATGSTQPTRDLAVAWLALDEADDFFESDGRQNLYSTVRSIVECHESTILPRDGRLDAMSKMAAAQAYYTFAREKMQMALGQDPLASKALFSLGKLYSLPTSVQGSPGANRTAMAMLCHYAALDCDSANYVSANELGVLLARNGRLADAKAVLDHSVNTYASVAGLQNLARVHDELGEADQAQWRRQQAAAFSGQTGDSPNGQFVQWVEPNQFAQSRNPADEVALDNMMSTSQPTSGDPNATQRLAERPNSPSAEKGTQSWGQKLKSWF